MCLLRNCSLKVYIWTTRDWNRKEKRNLLNSSRVLLLPSKLWKLTDNGKGLCSWKISHCMLVLYTLASFGQVFVKSIKEVNQTNQNQNIYFFNWTLECKRTKSLHSPHVLQQKSKNFIHQLSTPSSSDDPFRFFLFFHKKI